ncbi:MAG TPA: hypothetical protein VFT01_07625 [Homoserinimonas sp.]|nr:hypothetical protein [Homoserinimonas sp.]
MRVRYGTVVAILAVALIAVAVAFGRPSPPETTPSPSAASLDAGANSPPGQEEAPTAEEPPSREAPPAAIRPLISAPLPETSHREGAFVEGFPQVITLAPHSEVTFSSVASEGDRVQAALGAMSTNAPTEVLEHYRAAFAEAGLTEGSVSTADGSDAVSFERGPSSITVTVWSTDTGSRFMVFGILVVGI